jgi:NitT/TauT family transport system ATP-binding protein
MQVVTAPAQAGTLERARAIEFAGVGKTFSSGKSAVHAVDEINCEILPGQFVSIVGPSGCGKSSLLMMIAGLSTPTKGKVHISGSTVTSPRTELGVAFQDACLLPWRTALQNILLQSEIRKESTESAKPRAMQLLKQVGLAGFEDRYPSELSGGMAQRVALCRALLHNPDILLMDEPFGALDALTRDQMQLDLQSLWLERGKTVVLVTHSIDEAVFLSDRVLVMSPRPSTLAADIEVPFERPRNMSLRTNPEFVARVERIREIFTEIGVFDKK